MKKKSFLKYCFVFLLIASGITFSYAKTVAGPPYFACFTVNVNRGCVPLTVTVLTDCHGPTVAAYNFDSLNFPTQYVGGLTPPFSHTYTVPGTYILSQEVNNGSGTGNNFGSITITVLPVPLPTFSVDICQGKTVHVKVLDNNYNTYKLDYGDGTPVSPQNSGDYTTHTYVPLGSETIKLTGLYTGTGACTGATSSQLINVIGPLPLTPTPDMIDLTVLAQDPVSGAINFRFYAPFSRYKYSIEQKTGAGVFSQIGIVQPAAVGIISYPINNLNTLANNYFYRVRIVDDCGNAAPYSDTLGSIIVNALAQNSQNQISWITSGFNTFDLNSDKGLNLTAVNSPTIDSPVKCGDTYCYTVTGNYLHTSTYTSVARKSYSAAVCTTAFSLNSPPLLTSVNCTVENSEIRVAWNLPASSAVSSYKIERSENGAGLGDYSTTNGTANSFVDATSNTAQSNYCYEVSYTDLCGNSSALSATTCQVLLKAVKNDDVNNVSWTAYTGYASSGIKEYILELLDESGSVVSSKSAGSSLNYSDPIDPSTTVIIYRIKVVPVGTESLISYSNIFRIDLSPQIFVPNTFSPNGDGTNDDLSIKGKYFKDFRMTILNRWGEVVYYTEDVSKSWDGKYKGTQADADSYAYAIEAKDNSGKEISKKGIVTIVR